MNQKIIGSTIEFLIHSCDIKKKQSKDPVGQKSWSGVQAEMEGIRKDEKTIN